MKTSLVAQAILNKKYIRFDERGHKNIKQKPFLKPTLEMVMKKIFKKRKEIFYHEQTL